MIDEERAAELDRQRKIVKRNKQIPYDFMKKAKAALEEKFPDSAHVDPKVYMGQVYCEVWDQNGRAKIYFCYEA